MDPVSSGESTGEDFASDPASDQGPRKRCRLAGSSSDGRGFRRLLHLFRVTRRRHDGDERDVAMLEHLHVVGNRDVAEMLRVADLETGQVDVDRLGDGIRRAIDLKRMLDDVHRAAALSW